MNNIWFTSDTHFGHKNILEYEKIARPFSLVEEMNEKLIENWNSVVKDHDTVFHLGDFCFGRENVKIAGRLKGRKKLILGNHDVYYQDYLPFFKVYGAFYWKKCVLTHIPVHINQILGRAVLNIHGHLHSNYIEDIRYLNVSVERCNLTPIHADVILDRIREFGR